MAGPANVLFITADQWRGECLSALDHPCLKTPVLDALAAEGVLFCRHFSQASPCAPGRASLYTGMYLLNHRVVVNGAPLDTRHGNLALEARKAGYDPVLFGYTDATADPRRHHPADPALRTYEGILPGMTPIVHLDGLQLPWIAHLRALGYDLPVDGDAVFAPQADVPGAAERGPTFPPARYKAEHSNTAFLTDEAIKYLSVRGARPWFIHLSYLAPHPPFIVPEPYHTLYHPDEVPAPVRAASPEAQSRQHPWLGHDIFKRRGTPPTYGLEPGAGVHFSEAHLRQLRATYYAMMSEVDTQLGRLFDYLKSQGLYDNTLIVFTTDHGEHLGDHWLFGKSGYFEQAFHIPLIIRNPRPEAAATRGTRVEAFSENVDVMPTILDWLDLEVPVQCDGLSLLPFCRGTLPAQWRSEAHWEYDFRDRVEDLAAAGIMLKPDQCSLAVLRGERYKYVHFTALPPLFFDLQEDPQEFHNLASEPGYRDLVLEHAQMMLSWRMNHAERATASLHVGPKGVTLTDGPRW